MPAADFILWLGETRNVSFPFVSPDGVAVTISNVRTTIWDAAGTASPNDAAGSVDAASAGGPWGYYAWTPAAAGDYTGELKADIEPTGVFGGETQAKTFSAQVWPRTSLLRPFIDRIRGLTHDAARALGEDAADLSLRDYYEALLGALAEYSRPHPRRLQSDVSLTASQWEYNLSALAKVAAGAVPAAQWTPEFSEITLLEPRVDATLPSQWFVGAGDVRNSRTSAYGYQAQSVGITVDEARGVWRFTALYPASGDTARVEWTAPQICNHTQSSLPVEPVTGRAVHFEALCRYAAGCALERLAAQAASTNEAAIEAQVVSYNTKFERYSALSKRLKDEAVKAWTRRTWAF